MDRTRGAPPMDTVTHLLNEESTVTIYVDTGGRRLQFVPEGSAPRMFQIAVGKPSTPTPTGRWRIGHKRMNPGGVLGSRWMGLNVPTGNYGIHGTNAPGSIGRAVSNGCIRLHNRDVESIYGLCPVGTSVLINLGLAPSNGSFPGWVSPPDSVPVPGSGSPGHGQSPTTPWSPSPGQSLRHGDRGPAVRALQAALAAAGHDPGPIDGIFGPLTERAVRAFQSSIGLAPTGVACPDTRARLGTWG